MRLQALVVFLTVYTICSGQQIDTTHYRIKVETSESTNLYFTKDPIWRGADGASTVDLENGKVLWLFSDTFICSDASGSRKKSSIIRNSIAIQDGYDLKPELLKYYWDKSGKTDEAFFHLPGSCWFWTGHGIRIKEKLIIFLVREKGVKTGLGFEACGWSVVLISNPDDEPAKWEMNYFEGPETFGLIVGSAAVLKDKNFLYAYGAVEPSTHEVYLLRWKLSDACEGNITTPQWWINGKWMERKTKTPVPEPLFIGASEFSVHYDASLKKYLQVQSFGFGEGTIGIRMSDSLQGKWTAPTMLYRPQYPGVKKPFMYTAKSHPELHSDGIYVTYNVNSFDFGELLENQNIYFPKFIKVVIANVNKP